MFTSGEKSVKPSTAIQRQAGIPFFARKFDSSFFRGAEKSFTGSSFIQPKLSVSQPDDPQEKEADQMAHRVMTMSETETAPSSNEKKEELQRQEDELQKAEEPEEEKQVQKKIQLKKALHRAAEEEIQKEEDKKEVIQQSTDDEVHSKEEDQIKEVQRNPDGEKEEQINWKGDSGYQSHIYQRSGRGPPAAGQNSFETALSYATGTGSPLHDETRSFMESRFDADFSGVRIHTGESSARMNSDIHAQAFTYGNDIFFNSGKYSPGTSEGQLLIAHELTHTIQQGASNHISVPSHGPGSVNNVSTKLIIRKKAIHRSASNLEAAVAIAKGEVGKVVANKKGPDGYRYGWQQLIDYYKTTLGPEKVTPSADPGDGTTVPEANIKNQNTAKNVDVVKPDGKVGRGDRDAMPSWCGIFAFWALNKAGLPLKKWTLGKMTIPPESALQPGATPAPGFLAYRDLRSHYGLVERSDGTSVTSINGNTVGDNNLGGEIQVQTHEISKWTAFIDPMKLIEGALRNPEESVEEKPKSLRDMQKEMFGVQTKKDGNKEIIGKENDGKEIHLKKQNIAIQPKTTIAVSTEADQKEEIKREEEKKEEEVNPDNKAMIQSASGSSPPAQLPENEPVTSVQLKSEPRVQRLFGWVSDIADWVGDKLEEGKKWVLGKVKDLIINVKGYKALRVVLGSDPITGEKVEQSGANFIDAAVDLMPFGSLIKQKLEELGILDLAAKFVEKAFGRVRKLISGIYDIFANFIESLSLSDLKDIRAVFRRLEKAFTSFFDEVIDFAKGIASDFLEFIKKALLIPLGTYIKNKTRFWDLLCLIIGKDPVTDEVKQPTGANILNAVLTLSDEGIEQRKKMQETGTFNKIAAWIDRGIAVFARAYDMLKAAFRGLWDAVSIHSLMHPVETFNKIFDSFWQPVALVGKFFLDALVAVLKIVKEVLFKWISAKAKETKGFYLVTVLIGKDPFTGESVPRTTENIIKGFMILSEGGEEQFNKMKESGAMDRATARIDAAIETLGFTWNYVKNLFIDLWIKFGWKDLLVPVLAFVKIINTFKDPILRLIRFIITVVVALFEVILRMMGFPVDLVFKLIDNVKKAWASIKSNPSGFLMNLLKAIKQGFSQFFDNILTHLWNGLKAWLKQELEDAGVPMPADYTAMGIIKWILQILDITMEKIWKKLEERIGKEKVDKIRSLIAKAEAIYDKANEAIEFIEDVRNRGMDAIVDKIKEKLSNMWDLVLEAIKGFIMDQIIKKVTAKLLSMLDPTGIMAVINSAIALYKAIQSFFKYLARILAIVNSFVEGIIEICAGNIAVAANFLENALASGIPVVIGFLANQVGLDLSGRIRDILGTVREKVDKGLDFLIDKLVGLVEKLVVKVMQAKDKVLGWLGLKKDVKTKDEVSHTLYFTGSGDSATLMIATTPMAVKKYLVTEVKDKHGLKDSDIQQPLKTAGDIESLEKASSTDEAKKVNDMSTQLTKLAGELALLPLTSAGTNSEILYGPLYHEHGSSATVAFRQAPFPAGSSPMGSSTTTLSKMNIRKQGGSPYYIKGHLLNDNLGGPGTTWANLTPINSKANSDHKTNFENPVKEAVNGKLSGSSATTLGFMKGFSVVANYGRTVPPSLTQLKDESASTYPSGFDEAKWDIEEVIDILENELYAPVKLICNATIKKDASSPEVSVSYPVENEIHYGDLTEYQLGLAPKIYIQLSDLIKKNPGAVTEKEMDKTFAGIKGIGPARAKKIYETFKSKERITNGKDDIGIGLVALNRQNKGKVISSGEYSGPWV